MDRKNHLLFQNLPMIFELGHQILSTYLCYCLKGHSQTTFTVQGDHFEIGQPYFSHIQLLFWFSETCESIILKKSIDFLKLWIFRETELATLQFFCQL